MRRTIMAVMMALAFFSLMADTINVGVFTYYFNPATNIASITAYNGSASHVNIPSSIEVPEQYKDEDGEWHTRYRTYFVTSIGYAVFANKEFITSVNIPSGVEVISTQAFEGCTGLTSVRTSGLLKSIGIRAFKGCTSLVSADIDGTDLDLSGSWNIFEGCTSLRDVRFGDGVVGLSNDASYNVSGVFPGCTSLESVSVGNGLSSVPRCFLYNVGSGAGGISVSFDGPISFVGSYALNNGSIKSLRMNLANCEVGGSGFASCRGVTTESIDFTQIVSIGYSAFQDCVNLSGEVDLAIANAIGGSAFAGCTGLTSVRTSGLLKSIGIRAFKGCTSLVSADIDGTDLDLSGSWNIFEGCTSLRGVRFGDGVVGLSRDASYNVSGVFPGCTSLESVSVGNGLSSVPRCFLYNVGSGAGGISVSFDGPISFVGSYALNNGSIKSLRMNLANCEVGGSGFASCRGVTTESIDFTQIASIGYSAFQDCVNLSGEVDLAIANAIGDSAFAGCVGLRRVSTSEMLKCLGSYAFRDCCSLEYASIDGANLDLSGSQNIFENCTSLRDVRFGDGVIGLRGGYTTYPHQSNTSGVFKGCTSIETVIVGRGLANVPKCFLSNVGSDGHDISVSFNGPISYVGCSAFDNTRVSKLVINLSGCTVEHYGFFGCRGVATESIDFTQIVSIGSSAFQDCVNITNKVVFSARLTSIGSSAFANCGNAHDFAFLGAPPSASSSSFSGVKSGAIGTYTAEYEAEWKAVIDSRGYWNGLKMRPSYYTVHYDLNGGSGAIDDDVVEYGSGGIKIEADGVSWEGCYLVGWAFEADGEVAYVEGDTIAEPTGDSDSVTLYAKWIPAPDLKVESVDWTEGKISLRWAEGDGKDGWRPCTLYRGTTDSLASAEALPDAQETTATSYVDDSFLTATPVTAPLYYWVVPKGVDISQTEIEPVVTRQRHYLCVGNTNYEGKWEADLMDGDAAAFEEILKKKGGFKKGDLLKNVDRNTLRSSIRSAIGECGKGDIFVLYIMAHGGHGGVLGNRSWLSMRPYREFYFNTELASDLATADSDTAVISFLPVCHSGAIIDASSILGNTAQVSLDAAQFLNDGLGQCTANMAAIAACSADVTAPAAEIGSFANPITYFCKDAVEKGCADIATEDGIVTWRELFDYVTRQQILFTPDSVSQMVGNESMLRKLTLVENVSKVNGSVPLAPASVSLSVDEKDDKVVVDWDESAGADWYVVSGNFNLGGKGYLFWPNNLSPMISRSAFESHVANISVAAGNAYGCSDWRETILQIGKRVCDLSATTNRSDCIKITWSINSPAKACVLSRYYANDPEISLFNDDRLLSIGKHEVYDDKVEAERAVEYTLSVQFEGEEDWVEVKATGYRKQGNNEAILELESAPKTIDACGGYVYVRLRANGKPATNHSGDGFCSELSNLGDTLLLFCERNYDRACRDHTVRFTLGEKELMYTLRQYGTDSLPSVDKDEDVSVVLARSDDGRLMENVTDKKTYEDLRYWMSENGISVQDAEISAHVYPSYVLGTDRLLENEPTIEIGEVKVGAETTDGLDVDIGTITVSVTVKDGDNPIKVAEKNVAALFESTCNLDDWDGEARLTPKVNVLEGEGNTLRFRVTPGDGRAARAFLRIRK